MRCEYENTSPWSCTARAEYKLLSLDPNQKPYQKPFGSPNEHKAGHKIYGFEKCILKSELFKPRNNHVKDNSIVMEVKIKCSAIRTRKQCSEPSIVFR